VFSITGIIGGGLAAHVSWRDPADRRRARLRPDQRGIEGNGIVRAFAIADEVLHREFRSTPTGPSFVSNLDDPEATLVQLASYFTRIDSVDGDVPIIAGASIPDGAVA
jgi:hypothetical protein